MADEHDDEVPEGAAIFPEIPVELGVNPLLLTILQALVFIAGSDDSIIEPEAADEALELMARYLQRLEGADLERTMADMKRLENYARREGWAPELLQFLNTFLSDFGVGPEQES